MQQLRNVNESALAGQCARELLAGIPGVMRFLRSHMRENRAELTIPQFRALVLLNLVERPSLSELADHLGLSLPAASRMVDLLVRRGLVQRKSGTKDRRRILLLLTPAGRQTFRAAHQGAQAALAEHLQTLSRNELSRLESGMKVLSHAFTNPNGQAATPPAKRRRTANPRRKSPRRRSGVVS